MRRGSCHATETTPRDPALAHLQVPTLSFRVENNSLGRIVCLDSVDSTGSRSVNNPHHEFAGHVTSWCCVGRGGLCSFKYFKIFQHLLSFVFITLNVSSRAEMTQRLPQFLEKSINVQNATYEILSPITELRSCHDGTPAESRILFMCRRTAPTPDDVEVVLKVKVQYVVVMPEPRC
jgi:hypothetical protein